MVLIAANKVLFIFYARLNAIISYSYKTRFEIRITRCIMYEKVPSRQILFFLLLFILHTFFIIVTPSSSSNVKEETTVYLRIEILF